MREVVKALRRERRGGWGIEDIYPAVSICNRHPLIYVDTPSTSSPPNSPLTRFMKDTHWFYFLRNRWLRKYIQNGLDTNIGLGL